ncbi:MAG: TonB-dependent receptor [Acidobacteriota bacterium]
MPMRLIHLACAFFLLLSPNPARAEMDESADSTPSDTVEEVIVVTASRSEQQLLEAPASISVLDSRQIEAIPSSNYGDVLRNVPGLNVAQMSNSTIQITGRQATQALPNSQLVLLDGRTLYLDHLGFVAWEFLPVDARELDRIEVVRGPGSAVWGANAMSGVINLITQSPRQLVGTSVLIGGGELGSLFGGITHAGVRDNLAYKVSGGYRQQDAYDRPTGLIPGTQTVYPAFDNRDIEQPRLDLQLEVTRGDTLWNFAGGFAESNGNIHTPVGPWTFEDGSGVSYLKADWDRHGMHFGAYINSYDSTSVSQVSIDSAGNPITSVYALDAFHFDFNDSSTIGDRHFLSYGASLRHIDFEITIAPGDSRDEMGIYLQDEIQLGDRVKWVVGARWDDNDPVGSEVSPRTSLIFAPSSRHSLRVSYNQAFRVPSQLENFISMTAGTLLPLPTGPYIVPTRLIGQPDLVAEELEAFELGWTGRFGKTQWSVAAYRNEVENAIDFFPGAFYSSANPPPDWPLPPQLLDGPLAGLLEIFTPMNIGTITNEGLEVAVDARLTSQWSWFVNYSYQAEPEVEQVRLQDVNIPPEHRFNAGIDYRGESFFGSATVNYSDEAVWTDVLDARFYGTTDAYTLFNISAGVHLAKDRCDLTIKGHNVFDEEAQQHIFGDIIGRKVTAELLFRF